MIIKYSDLSPINKVLFHILGICCAILVIGFIALIGFMIGYQTRQFELERTSPSNVPCSIVIKDTAAERIEYTSLCEVDMKKLLVDKNVKKA